MIRILQILTDSNIGGAGRCLINYLKYRDRDRFSVAVVLPVGSALIPEVEKQGVPVIEAEGIAEKSFDWKAIRTLSEIIRAQSPDLVHTHGSFSGRIAARRCGVRVIYTRHSAFPVPWYLRKGPGHALCGAINSHYADAIIAVSPATAENLTDSGVPSEKITVMMNGVEPVPRRDPESCRALRETLGIPEGVFTAGILARLEPYKGHSLLVDAAAALRREGRDFRFLIGGSGSCEEALREQIRTEGLTEQVKLLGFVDDVAGVLSLLDVQLNCSWGTEASSIALNEGMSLGLPTVASDYGGNPWLIDDGETGLLFRNRDAADLAEKLRRLMDDPSLRDRLGQNARRAYETRFTGEIFASNLERVYDNVLGK